MSLYRVKQFFWAVFSRINKEDKIYIQTYLDKDEQQLFSKLSVSEQKHSIRVVKELERRSEMDKGQEAVALDREEFIKIALLHDIGKIERKLNPIDKSILVILDKVAGSRMRKMTNVKKIDVYYNHAEKGYILLSRLDKYSDRFLYLVRNHHENDIIEDRALEILKEADSLS
ncbi:MAG TPA: HD family phosphohydrolase [Clostridium sp.]|jgi:putative nucleotidyltransferase with HDIG domain|nr:HDIG domain-containing protein [Clostridia bacterium]HCW04194.1 HD family phosphohydrolase [Clostridium sp.]